MLYVIPRLRLLEKYKIVRIIYDYFTDILQGELIMCIGTCTDVVDDVSTSSPERYTF